MDMVGDSLDESLATCMTSSKVIWQVYLGLHFEAELWADYKLADNMCIGDALWQKKDEMNLEQDKTRWTINSNLMTKSMTQQALSRRFGKPWWHQRG